MFSTDANNLRLRRTAYHEAGHALAAACWNRQGFLWATIVPDDGMFGHVECLGPDRSQSWVGAARVRHAQAIAQMRIAVAGLCAVEIVLRERMSEVEMRQEMSTPGSDIHAAISFVHWGYPHRKKNDAEPRIGRQYGLVGRFLRAHRRVLDRIAAALLSKRTLTADGLSAILARQVYNNARTWRTWNRWRTTGIPRLPASQRMRSVRGGRGRGGRLVGQSGVAK